jgi:hypothetical protein
MASAVHCDGWLAGCLGEIDSHGNVRRYDHSFAGQVIKAGLIKQVHHFFTPQHAGNYQVAKS